MRLSRKYSGCILVGLLLVLGQGCVEPYEIKNTDFNSYIVIEATMTDEHKTQQVLISRTFPLDTVQTNPERNAVVVLTDSNGSSYAFSEAAAGRYVSNASFAAVAGQSYTLSVQTSDGKRYVSETAVMPPAIEIEEVYAAREVKDGIEEGIFVYVDSYDPSGNSKYYRYEYEETYKITAPFFTPVDAYVVAPLPEPQVALRPRQQEERICYNTLRSNTILQTKTTELNEDRVTRFPVRFISRESAVLRDRYSILVKQYVQTREAHEYYTTLAALSGSESLFNQIQTGFLEGNLRSEDNSEENVIGYFQLSSVSEKRIFFNYTDFFQGERLPEYFIDCEFLYAPLLTLGGSSPLIDGIETRTIKYYDDYDSSNPLNLTDYGPYVMVPVGCGDCTALGSNLIPDFWEEP